MFHRLIHGPIFQLVMLVFWRVCRCVSNNGFLIQLFFFVMLIKSSTWQIQTSSYHCGAMQIWYTSKSFPTYRWNIPQTQNQQFMKEFLSYGGVGRPGVCETGVCWGSLRIQDSFHLKWPITRIHFNDYPPIGSMYCMTWPTDLVDLQEKND